jgi:pimeloyl-ACP methyl ester carboxylesterase
VKTDLEVATLGSGPRVVFVHGSIVGAETTWRHQADLAEHWTLCLPNRPGFGSSPPLERGDFEAEAPLIAELLEDGAHLVGHSYGAVIALFAAAKRPGSVRSLTVSEPGALRVAAGDPVVDALIAPARSSTGSAMGCRRATSCCSFAAGFIPPMRRPIRCPSTWRGERGT